MVLHWPQITMLFLMTLGLGVTIAKNGEPRTPHSAKAMLFNTVLTLGLLYAGGFFG